MTCPKCGAPMNCHAEKLDLTAMVNEPRAVDADWTASSKTFMPAPTAEILRCEGPPESYKKRHDCRKGRILDQKSIESMLNSRLAGYLAQYGHRTFG